MKKAQDKYLTGATAFALTANLILFAVKLYIGLSANSISIYSDGINNLFDSLSGGLALVCFIILSADKSVSSASVVKGCENLLSFIMSVIVGIAGFAFAYSSFERLMYPTPVWYRKKYLYLLVATAAAKLCMHFIFRALGKKSPSPVLRVMAFDSLLDFFITAVTAVGLVMVNYSSYSIDALCGIGISLVIIVSAVKMIFSSAAKLIGFIPKEKREGFETLLFETADKSSIENITFLRGEDESLALLELSAPCNLSEEVLTNIKNETGITVHIIDKRKENTDNLCEMK